MENHILLIHEKQVTKQSRPTVAKKLQNIQAILQRRYAWNCCKKLQNIQARHVVTAAAL
jgi:hypothetical protein